MKTPDQLDLVPEQPIHRVGPTLFFKGGHCEVLRGRRVLVVRIRCGECGRWHGDEVGREEVALAMAEAAEKTQGLCVDCLERQHQAPEQTALL